MDAWIYDADKKLTEMKQIKQKLVKMPINQCKTCCAVATNHDIETSWAYVTGIQNCMNMIKCYYKHITGNDLDTDFVLGCDLPIFSSKELKVDDIFYTKRISRCSSCPFFAWQEPMFLIATKTSVILNILL